MTIEQMRDLYTRFERLEVEYPGAVTERGDNLVRVLDNVGGHDFIPYSRLDEGSVEEAIAGQIAYFESLGRDFEWKYYDYDTPGDLRERLAAHGFSIGEDECIMAFDLAEPAPMSTLTDPIRIERISDPARVRDIDPVHTEVWGEGIGRRGEELARRIVEQPEFVSLYVAYHGERAVSFARVEFPARSPFASLWGGSTLKEYRGKGIYTELLRIRIEEAKRRGYKYITIDASPMSRPIVARHGFRQLAVSNACDYEVRRA